MGNKKTQQAAKAKEAAQTRVAAAKTGGENETTNNNKTTATTAEAQQKAKAAAAALPFTKRPGKLQNCIYMFLVGLSLVSLGYLVYISLQPIGFSPCALMNGTWYLNPEKQKNPQEVYQKNQIVSVDLSECSEIGESSTGEMFTFPEEVLPIDIAPKYVKPLYINKFQKSFSGGAKVLFWSGSCQLASSSKNNKGNKEATCTFLLHRGYFSLSIFPSNDDSDNTRKNNKTPFTVIGTRIDGNEVADEAAFNKKVKYVLIIMVVVAVIHYALSAFQPPTMKQMKRDVAMGKLLEIERRKKLESAAISQQVKQASSASSSSAAAAVVTKNPLSAQ